MNNLNMMQGYDPLTDEEVNELEKYLAKYSKDIGEIEGGIDSISALDGFLTAVVSAPKHYPVGFWLDALFDFIATEKGEMVIADFWCKGYLIFIELTSFEIFNEENEVYLFKMLEGSSFMLRYAEAQGCDLNSDRCAELPPIELCEKNADEVMAAAISLYALGRQAYLAEMETQLGLDENVSVH